MNLDLTTVKACIDSLASLQRIFAALSEPTQPSSPVADAVIAGGGNAGTVVANLQREHGRGCPTGNALTVRKELAAIRSSLQQIPQLITHGNHRAAIERALDGCLAKAEAGDREGAAKCAAQALTNLAHASRTELVCFAHLVDPKIPQS